MSIESSELGGQLWNYIPSLVLTNIFDYLEPKDRYSAASTCKNWREIFFQKRYFKAYLFKLDLSNAHQIQFFRNTMCHLTNELVIKLDLLSIYHMHTLKSVLRSIIHLERLEGLRLQPINVELSTATIDREQYIKGIEGLIVPPLSAFLARQNGSCKILDFGCNKTLVRYAVRVFNNLKNPEKLEVLQLATLKFDTFDYSDRKLAGVLPYHLYTSLQVLSLDYRNVTDAVLDSLQTLPLKKFLIVVHVLDHEYDPPSDAKWLEFANTFPNIDLIVTLTYSPEGVPMLQNHILSLEMPLTHLRVLFCEQLSNELIEWLSTRIPSTLKSIQWVDSQYTALRKPRDEMYKLIFQDPFVMLAWRCKTLEEVVVHGYVMDLNNLVGIARLQTGYMKRLEVSMIEGEYSPNQQRIFENEIVRLLQMPWQMSKISRMHPALGKRKVGYAVTNDYIMSVMQADLRL